MDHLQPNLERLLGDNGPRPGYGDVPPTLAAADHNALEPLTSDSVGAYSHERILIQPAKRAEL